MASESYGVHGADQGRHSNRRSAFPDEIVQPFSNVRFRQRRVRVLLKNECFGRVSPATTTRISMRKKSSSRSDGGNGRVASTARFSCPRRSSGSCQSTRGRCCSQSTYLTLMWSARVTDAFASIVPTGHVLLLRRNLSQSISRFFLPHRSTSTDLFSLAKDAKISVYDHGLLVTVTACSKGCNLRRPKSSRFEDHLVRLYESARADRA